MGITHNGVAGWSVLLFKKMAICSAKSGSMGKDAEAHAQQWDTIDFEKKLNLSRRTQNLCSRLYCIL